jgi:DNA-binding NtrC family response regulator
MPRTVLLVDEDAAALADLRRTLHGSTYRVLSARGARPAFEVLALEPVHVIVCGSTLSDTTGVEFLARARLRHPNTVRVLVAAGTDAEAAERAVPEGTVHFALSRPPGPDLVEAVARGLEELDLLRETQRLLRAARRKTRERQECSPPRPR